MTGKSYSTSYSCSPPWSPSLEPSADPQLSDSASFQYTPCSPPNPPANSGRNYSIPFYCIQSTSFSFPQHRDDPFPRHPHSTHPPSAETTSPTPLISHPQAHQNRIFANNGWKIHGACGGAKSKRSTNWITLHYGVVCEILEIGIPFRIPDVRGFRTPVL